jgi:hypothetical protein
MRIFIVIIYLCFPLASLAKVGDTYHCTELFHKGVFAPQGEGGKVVEENYITQKFTFKRTSQEIIFNKNAGNSWSDYTLDIIKDEGPNKEYFWGFEETGSVLLKYDGGHFFYTKNAGYPFGVSYVYATCGIF